jgi:cold shock CspA family protein
MPAPRFEGVIVSWFDVRNFGFIKLDNPVAYADSEVFAHRSDFPNAEPLPKFSRVSFELRQFNGRYKAHNVRAVDPASDTSAVDPAADAQNPYSAGAVPAQDARSASVARQASGSGAAHERS